MHFRVSFLNVTNLGNAKIAGMDTDLQLYGNRYNVALSVFFVPYSLFEIPSNILLKIMRPSRWIAIMMFVWGVIMTLTGIVNSYEGLVVVRFFLGLAEAGFFPAAAYLLTLWYVDQILTEMYSLITMKVQAVRDPEPDGFLLYGMLALRCIWWFASICY